MAKPSTELASTLGDVDDEAEAQALAEAEADVAAGRLIPHGKVVRWLRSWGTARELPCPRWRK